jgi:hypothetical protein
LQLRADDADSKFNRDLVNRKINALRRPPDQGGGGGGGKGQGQGQGQPRPAPQGQPPPQGRSAPQGQAPPQGQSPEAGSGGEGHDQRQPGQMSPEEARELLDSEKSDEHHSLGTPSGPRSPGQTSDKAFKNW